MEQVETPPDRALSNPGCELGNSPGRQHGSLAPRGGSSLSGSVLVRLGSWAPSVGPGSLTSASWLPSMSRAGWEPLWIWPAYAARVPGSPGFPGPRREECDLPLPSRPMATRAWLPDGPRGLVPSALRRRSLPEGGRHLSSARASRDGATQPRVPAGTASGLAGQQGGVVSDPLFDPAVPSQALARGRLGRGPRPTGRRHAVGSGHGPGGHAEGASAGPAPPAPGVVPVPPVTPGLAGPTSRARVPDACVGEVRLPPGEAPACRYPWRSRWHAMTSVSAGPGDLSPASSHGVADGASRRPSLPRMAEVPAARVGRGTKDFHIARAPRPIRAVLRMGVVSRWGDCACLMHG